MKDYPKPINQKVLQNILNQMNNSIYKFSIKKGKFDFGFFYKIKYKENDIPVAIINNYQFDKHYINTINVIINNEVKAIELGDRRYKNKDYNITILEIKGEIDDFNFIEEDNDFHGFEIKEFYPKESIYIIQYNKENLDVQVSYGIINTIHKENIIYKANITQKNNFSLIFNLSNNKLIGIHQNALDCYNKGVLLKHIINEFINAIKYNQNYMNEIHITLNIDEDDINKDIYYLDNYEYECDGKIHFHDSLEELKHWNTEISINDEIASFNKYFKPQRIGEYNIKLKFNINLTDCSYMFAGCKNITNIKFISVNTKNIKNMKYMFYHCEKLEAIDLFMFDTKNVTDMSYLFYNCQNLKYLNLSSFDTRNVKNMSWMFYKCIKLNNLNVDYFNTEKVENMSSMFNECTNIINLNLTNFDTKNVKDMSKMFTNCTKLKDLNVKTFNTENVENMNGMFYGCKNLTELDIDSFDFRNVTNISYMFYECNNLVNLNLNEFDIRNAINTDGIYFGCNKLNSSVLDLI